jgi:hypothetical protein
VYLLISCISFVKFLIILYRRTSLKLIARGWTAGVRFPARAMDLYLLHSGQGVKLTTEPPSNAKGNGGAIPPLPIFS